MEEEFMDRIIQIFIVSIILSSLLLSGCYSSSSGTAPTEKTVSTSMQTGKAAPDFQLDSPDGQKVSLSSFKGKTVLINFWATWCGPCVGEMPLLQEVFSEYSSKGLVLLGINSGESASKVSSFLQRYQYNFPVLIDNNNEINMIYNIKYLPTTLLLDKDGMIIQSKVGPFENKVAITRMLSAVLPAK
jgi:peroxiredoxin